VVTRRAVLGGALGLLAPSAAFAQRPARAARLGVLLFSDPGSDPNMRAFRETLREHGYVEGQNLSIEYRHAEGHAERLAELAADLVRTKPDVIFTIGGDVSPFVKAATQTIPIVIVTSGDPVRGKLVQTLAAPGGNVTGVSLISSDLAPKRLQLLKLAAPRITRVAVLWNPDHHDDELSETRTAARTLGMDVRSVELRDMSSEDPLLTAIAQGADALMAVSSRTMVRNRAALVDFAAKHRIPLAGGWGLWADAGALLSYGPDVNLMVRRAAGYVDRILKGAQPAKLPVEQPTKFELVVNMKTAKALSLTPPQTLLLQADRVIQ